MLLGLAGYLTADSLALLAAFGWLGIALFGRQELKKAVQRLLRTLAVIKAAAVRRPLQAALLLTTLLFLMVRMAAHVWFLPPYIHDANTYHLPRVAEWIQSGTLTVPHLPVKRVYWPAGFELMQTWWAVFPHHDAVVEAAGIPFFMMAVAAVFILGRNLGLQRLTSAWCSFLFAFTPALAINATSSKNDIAIAALYLYLAAIWTKAVDRRIAGRRWLLTFLAVCLGIGIKPTMGFILPGLLWLGFIGFRKTDIRFFRRINISRWAAVLVAAALLVGSYWYVRNWIRFGNPFYPTSVHVLASGAVSATDAGNGGQQGAFSLASAGENWHLLWTKKIYDLGGPCNPDLPSMTGWGWFVFSCGAGCFLWGIFVNQRFRWTALSFLASLFLLFGWVTPDLWNMRFAQWFPALAALGFGVTVQHQRLLAAVRNAMILLAAASTALNALGILGNGYAKPEEWLAFMKTPVSQRALRLGGVVKQKSLDERIPAGEVILFMAESDDAFYPLYGPGFTRRILYPDDRRDGFAAAMKKYNARYLYFPDHIQREREKQRLADDLTAKRLESLGRGVYKIAEKNIPNEIVHP
ncbi:ArnT family glycosyltransferase [Candidatus Electronema sp. TJ]|uniref:ArnT family glycosyltransferase n=1 Tax=Candidatus Electronema sp. TJ TaxID=3401573 RepID=UPI003AA7F4D2